MRRISKPLQQPLHIEFDRVKYGRELLVDAALVRQMPTFITGIQPHSLAFHDILLMTRGSGEILLDGEAHEVASGVVVFSLPGQVREWRLTKPLDGACLFFTREFVADTFSDSRFLDQFAFFSAARPSASIRLSARERRAFGTHFTAMQRELAERRADASQLLRAHLYQLLTLLNRWYAEQHGELSGMAPTGFVERFRKLIERDFSRHRRVADYAAELGVTPGHLNALCRLQTQRSAGDLMRSRIVLEARRQLLYTQDSAAQIGERLGFNDPAYFTRFFRREVGQIPSGFRARRAS